MPREALQPQTMERPAAAVTDAEGEATLPPRDGGDGVSGAPATENGRRGQPVVTTIRGEQIPEELRDAVRAIRGASATTPRFAPTGDEISAIPRSGISPVVISVADYFLGPVDDDAQSVPVDDSYGDFVQSRLLEARDAIGEVDEAYRIAGEGERLLLRGTDGQWWRVWLTVERGALSDLEYSALSGDG